MFSAGVEAEERVYRWTDKDGLVHMGRTLPPEYSNKPYEILNKNGVVLQRVDDPAALLKPPPEVTDQPEEELAPLFTEDEARLRSDRLLVLQYHSEEELLAAMELKVDQLKYDALVINQSRASALTTLSAQIRVAADRQRAGMPDDSKLESDIGTLRNRLRRTEFKLDELKVREVAIRASFQINLERYQYLANGGKPGGIDSEIN